VGKEKFKVGYLFFLKLIWIILKNGNGLVEKGDA
jgi:hypothetical protein